MGSFFDPPVMQRKPRRTRMDVAGYAGSTMPQNVFDSASEAPPPAAAGPHSFPEDTPRQPGIVQPSLADAISRLARRRMFNSWNGAGPRLPFAQARQQALLNGMPRGRPTFNPLGQGRAPNVEDLPYGTVRALEDPWS